MSKIEEANAHMRQAEKSMKTSLMKWRPDFEVAADEYTRAATCFRVARDYKNCKECLRKAADCFKQNRSWFHAAKNIEQAVLICKEMGDLSQVQKLAHSSASLYQQHGSPESGASVLDKAGKMLESTRPEEALTLFQRAADIVAGEESPRQAAEYVSKAARLLVKLKMYDQAADAIRREIGLHQQINHTPSVGRLAVALVLVQLARGDQVAAEKAFKEWGNNCEAPEVQTLEMLLQAYDNEDADAARAALNSPFIKHMDVEYAKLARGMPLPQQEYTVPPAGIRANAAASYISPNANKLTGRATVEAEVNQDNGSDGSNLNEGQSHGNVGDKTETQDGATYLPSSSASEKKEEPGNAGEEDEYEGGLC